MKQLFLLTLASSLFCMGLYAQSGEPTAKDKKEIQQLIDSYSQARETLDTALLQRILTTDIDQLVSSGEWRTGMEGAMKGMMRSSTSNPGDRTLTIDKLRFLSSTAAIVDARYEIKNANGSVRKMWSTFIVVEQGGVWKISAIRNMLPAGNP